MASGVPGLDLSKATFSGDYVQQLQAQSQRAFAATSQQASRLYSIVWYILLPLLVLFGLFVLYDYLASKVFTSWPNIGMFDKDTPAPSSKSVLFIDKAIYSNDTSSQDVTTYLRSQIQSDTTLPSFVVGYAQLGLSTDLTAGKTPNTLAVSYHLCDDPDGTYSASVVSGQTFPSLPQSNDVCGTASGYKSTAPKNPGFFSRVSGMFTGGGSGDLSPSFHDASSTVSIPANKAPLSAEREGGYGMQWWMYIKDWNYGYGKEKSVVKRPDATNSAVMNPKISLHPTDNSLKISVSVFPNTEGGSGKVEPAPAGHSGSTDDVFVCEVSDVPLQAWFSVGVTVFGRNLDVYIDGKLVKSCFITGVPKPAAGDIQLTPDGGFSGHICNFNHYPRMLTPGDAMNFWSAGTPCQSKTVPGSVSKATGYSVKFGVYDSLGKEIQEYAF